MEAKESSDKTYWANFLDNKLERLMNFHNHKENMVNAGFIVQLTLFSTIIMRNIWPPQWMVGLEMVSGLSTLIVYFIFWLFLHTFIDLQLQNKRVTALEIIGYESALKNLVFSDFKSINTSFDPSLEKEKVGRIKKFIRRVLPIGNGSIRTNFGSLPIFITDELNYSFSNGTRPPIHESLLKFGSLLMLALSALRMLSYIFN